MLNDVSLVKLPSDDCQWTLLMTSQYWISYGNDLVPSGTSHYLSQSWPRSMSPYGATRPQWFKLCSLYCYHDQSGTKPNLVAKIWPPTLVTIYAWLPKLVDNVSSKFHHLVNTWLAVGSLFKWLPITVSHTCKLDTIWVVYTSMIGNGSIRL